MPCLCRYIPVLSLYAHTTRLTFLVLKAVLKLFESFAILGSHMTLVKFDVLIYKFHKFHFYQSKYLDRFYECQTNAATEWTLLWKFKLKLIFLLLLVYCVNTKESKTIIKEPTIRLLFTKSNLGNSKL